MVYFGIIIGFIFSKKRKLLQFMVFSTWFFSKKKPKNERHKKYHFVNLDKSFWTCPTRLGSQIGPCHSD
jgi:hypothetical protein